MNVGVPSDEIERPVFGLNVIEVGQPVEVGFDTLDLKQAKALLDEQLLRIVGALTAPTSAALTCRWRSRPQNQLRTYRCTALSDALGQQRTPTRSAVAAPTLGARGNFADRIVGFVLAITVGIGVPSEHDSRGAERMLCHARAS